MKDNFSSFWCFVFLSRCLIYKVHAPAFRPAVRYILAHSFSLVKYFFRSFSTFCLKYSHSSPVRSSEELVHFNTLFRVCQALFSGFLAASQPANLEFSPFSERSRVSRELVYFTTRISLCQALFFGTALAFRRSVPLFSCPLVKRSDRIPPPPRFVNTFFHFFPGRKKAVPLFRGTALFGFITAGRQRGSAA